MKTNLTLIGFMGVGKTTIGKILAKKLEMDFIDIDREIEKNENMSISQIFEKKGEIYFRTLESKVIFDIKNKSNTVIATGGGVILNKSNIDSLHEHSNICLLESEVELIYQRISRRKGKRPLLDTLDPLKEIKLLLSSRKGLYQRSCDFKVANTNEGVEELAEKIKKIYIKEM